MVPHASCLVALCLVWVVGGDRMLFACHCAWSLCRPVPDGGTGVFCDPDPLTALHHAATCRLPCTAFPYHTAPCHHTCFLTFKHHPSTLPWVSSIFSHSPQNKQMTMVNGVGVWGILGRLPRKAGVTMHEGSWRTAA